MSRAPLFEEEENKEEDGNEKEEDAETADRRAVAASVARVVRSGSTSMSMPESELDAGSVDINLSVLGGIKTAIFNTSSF